MIAKPLHGTFPSYYNKYIDNISGNILEYLEQQRSLSIEYLKGISKEKHDFSYGDGKWTVKQVLIHLNDSERIFGYRSLCISRKESQNLPGFEQENYVNHAESDFASFDELINEFNHLRKANISMYKNIKNIQWDNQGEAAGFKVPLRLFPFVLAGHMDHHLTILKNRY